jgi:cardiolipin synthase
VVVPAWLPNAISAFRIALIPLWLVVAERSTGVAASEGAAAQHTLTGILVVLGLSDVVDGLVARRFGLASSVGATLDAIADKLAQVAFVTYLVFRAHPLLTPVPIWFWAILVARDGLLAAGYLVVKRRRGRVDTEHAAHGKASSVLLFALVVTATAGVSPTAPLVLTWVSAPLLVASTLLYVRDGTRQLTGAPPTRSTTRGGRGGGGSHGA